MYFLGACCRDESAGTNGQVQSFQWFKTSAELGDRFGQYGFGVLLQTGLGTTTNGPLAFLGR